MMISRRPVSSPGRVEPLMGFLRSKSNGGSRSRSKVRSRASPLFVRRNKSAAAVTQEPSSPKVTCMGQVRVNRSKPKIQPEIRENPTRRRCEWIRNASFYNKFAGKIRTTSWWPHWKLFSSPSSQRKSKNEKEKDSPRSELDHSATESAIEIEGKNEDEGRIFRIPKLFVSPASTTPIDAILFTRSRSAPYTTSSLAYKFWEENNEREAESRNDREQNVKSENESEGKLNVVVNETEVSLEANIDRKAVRITDSGFVRPEVLTRSKSEPARIGEKMVLLPEVS